MLQVRRRSELESGLGAQRPEAMADSALAQEGKPVQAKAALRQVQPAARALERASAPGPDRPRPAARAQATPPVKEVFQD